jgi:hypothetical protein
MDTKRFVVGTVVAAIVLSAAGIVIFGVLLPDFYTGFMNAGSATGVPRQPILWWPVGIGMLSYGALIALAIVGRRRDLSATEGMTTGAVVSFLMWFAADCLLYGISNVGNVVGIVVDPLLEAVPGALAGGLVAALSRNARNADGRMKTAA